MADPQPEPADRPADAPSLGSRLGSLALEALPAIIGTVGFVGFIAVIGGAIQWTRFWAAELPSDQAVRAMPKAELVSTALFTVLGLAALLLVYLLDHRGAESARARRGLLVILAVELACSALIIDLAWWEYLLLVGWAVLVAIAAYRPVEHAARAIGAHLDRAPDDDPAVVEDRAVYEGEAERMAAAEADFEAARDAWDVAQLRWRRRSRRERAEAAHAWRAAQDAHDLAHRRWTRIEREHAPHNHDRPRRAREPWLAQLVPALVVLGVGLVPVASYDETRWLLGVLAVPPLLFVALVGVSRASPRFAWYGVAVFLSVPFFGGVLAVADTLHTPRVQPIAVARKSDDRALCGVYITQANDRLYVGRVQGKSGSDRKAEPRSGRIFSIPMSDVDIATVGPLQSIPQAERRAIALLDEIYVDRAEEAATAVKNETTVKKTTENDGTKTTTTTERAAGGERPARRPEPRDHPPKGCAGTGPR